MRFVEGTPGTRPRQGGFVMTYRLSGLCGAASPILVCVSRPGPGHAQEPPIPIKPPVPEAKPLPPPNPIAPPLIRRPDWEAATTGGAACPAPAHPGGGWEFGVAAGPT